MAFASRVFLLAAGVAIGHAVQDCQGAAEAQLGPLGTKFHDVTWKGTQFYALVPDAAGPWPLVVYMHGATGAFPMYAFPEGEHPSNATHYARPLNIYASHGYVILFPFVKNPKKDTSPLTTNTNGDKILAAIDFAKAAQSDPSSFLNGVVDLTRVASLGHSMGATCSIMAGQRLPAGALKLVVTQHPGICGPFGPPPWPSTWSKSDLAEANGKFPLLFTTAHNDGAFWPAPYTAEHELGCFKKSNVPGPAIFAEFTDDACVETGKSKPWTDGGHDCPFKPDVETPWVLRALKLYMELGGDSNTACFRMLYGSGDGSLSKSPTVATSIVLPPKAAVASESIVV